MVNNCQSRAKDNVTYAVKLNVTANGFTYGTSHSEELKYTLTDKVTGEVKNGNIPLGATGDVTLATITKEVPNDVSYNYSLKIEFLNVNENQNHNSNKSLTGNLKVEFANA